MQYSVLIYESDKELAQRDNPESSAKMMAAYTAYSKALREAGVLQGGQGLQKPSTATTVRLRDGKRQIQDGPFADTKEKLGGFYIIEVANLDAALEWAALCPAASTGSIEVRPTLPAAPK